MQASASCKRPVPKFNNLCIMRTAKQAKQYQIGDQSLKELPGSCRISLDLIVILHFLLSGLDFKTFARFARFALDHALQLGWAQRPWPVRSGPRTKSKRQRFRFVSCETCET